LLADLEAISARDRVSWKENLVDVILALAAERAPGSESDIKTVQERVRNDSVLGFLATELASSAMQHPVDPQLCALPVETVSATFRSLDGFRNLDLVVKGLVEKRAAAEFTIEADAGIDAVLVLPSNSSGGGVITSGRYINKPLLLRGLVTLDQFELPAGAELATIEARPDDPDRSLWQNWKPESDVDTWRKLALWVNDNREFLSRTFETMRPFHQAQATAGQIAEATQALHENQEYLHQAADAARIADEHQRAILHFAEWMYANQDAIRMAADTVSSSTSPGNSSESVAENSESPLDADAPSSEST
jgi:hypothetical protein